VAAPAFAGRARRRALRHRCHLMNLARVTAVGEGPRLAWVHNLSVVGVGLVVESPFACGTALDIKLLTSAGARLALRGRVTHATCRTADSWLVGCAFSQPVTDEDLEAVL